jgi:VanZ family protein
LRFWRITWVCWAILIAVLSFIPGNQLPQITWELISIDTLAHFLMYGGLAFSMILGGFSKNLNLSPGKLYIITLLAGICYGTSIELIQGFYIYQRYFDTLDIFANTIGTVFGVITARLTGIKLV